MEIKRLDWSMGRWVGTLIYLSRIRVNRIAELKCFFLEQNTFPGILRIFRKKNNIKKIVSHLKFSASETVRHTPNNIKFPTFKNVYKL